MSVMETYKTDAKRELLSSPGSVVITLVTIALYFGVIGLIAFSTAHQLDAGSSAGDTFIGP